MVAVSMSVSIRLGATAVSVGVALYYMRISMTVKKVFNPYYSTLTIFILTINTDICNDTLQLAVITLSTVWVALLPAPTGPINTQARRHAPGHSPLLLATASELYVLLPCSFHNFACQSDIYSCVDCCVINLWTPVGIWVYSANVKSCFGISNMWWCVTPPVIICIFVSCVIKKLYNLLPLDKISDMKMYDTVCNRYSPEYEIIKIIVVIGSTGRIHIVIHHVPMLVIV